MPSINSQRLLDDLRRLRAFGAQDNGVVRPSLSAVDVESRHWLVERYQAAGLETAIDGVGNVFGFSPNKGPALMIGSHSDTQPKGGWLDGALGVIYGLEVARALAEDPDTAHLAVDAVSWIDEEGTFLGCLGSRAFCDTLAPDALDTSRNSEGVTLREALQSAGFADYPIIKHDPERQIGYLEAHIEQGPFLEAQKNLIGVVTGIVGIRGFDVSFSGQQNHAGTTPMHLRKDAGMAALEFGHRVNLAFKKLASDRTVWTIGKISFDPGAPSIIPGQAEIYLQMRDPDEARLDAMENAIQELAGELNTTGPVAVLAERARAPVRPTKMDDGFQSHIRDAAEQHAAGRWVSMPSAAGHDPMVLSQSLACAMLFIPSIGGISHDFAEDSFDQDIVLGCQVLADASATILKAHQAS